MTTVSLVEEKRFEMPAEVADGYVTMMGHSHNIRSGKIDAETATKDLVAWATRHWEQPSVRRFGAIGIGSPWDPVSFSHYLRCEREDRDRYWAGQLDPEQFMEREAVEGTIRKMNELSGGKTLFFLDNETPKNRYGHLWYVGFQYVVPAFHDYAQDKRVALWDEEDTGDLNAITGKSHLRRSYAEVVAEQRKGGAIAVWAHPTSWWLSNKGDFVTNIAAEMILHLLADGGLDGMVVQGYDAYHRQYQNLWFDLLDRGAIIPGYSEMDACFDHLEAFERPINFLNYIAFEPGKVPAKVQELIPACRAGNFFMSSGAVLTLEVAGKPMGSVIKCAEGDVLQGRIQAWPVPGETKLSHVQLVGKGGEVVLDVKDFTGGSIDFTVTVDACGGYLVARAFGENDSATPVRHQDVKHHAITNPVYLRTAASPVLPTVRTQLTLRAKAGSAHEGQTFRIVTAGGDPTGQEGVLTAAGVTLEVHGLSRVQVAGRDIPIAMANPAVRKLMDYLAEGYFRDDFPGCESGDVPAAAYRVDDMAAAMRTQELVLG